MIIEHNQLHQCEQQRGNRQIGKEYVKRLPPYSFATFLELSALFVTGRVVVSFVTGLKVFCDFVVRSEEWV